MIMLASLLCAMSVAGCAKAPESPSFTVLTSFYPMYVFTLNVTKDVEGVEVKNMAAPATGCLHDYALTTADMKALGSADVFVINGAGMELFMQKAIETNSELLVVDTSTGIDLVAEEEGHSHGHDDDEHEEEHEHEHGEYNSHIWMDPSNAAIQVANIASALSEKDPANAEHYAENAKAYTERINEAADFAKETLSAFSGEQAIAFHEFFTYFANRYGLSIVATVLSDEQNAPSSAELALAVDEVALHGIKLLFTDARQESLAARTIAEESGAFVVPLYTVLSPDGGDEYTAYERAIRADATAIADCLSSVDPK